MQIFINNIPKMERSCMSLAHIDSSLKETSYTYAVNPKEKMIPMAEMIGVYKYTHKRKSVDFTLVPLILTTQQASIDSDMVGIKIGIDKETLIKGCNIARDRYGSKHCPECKMNKKVGIIYGVKFNDKIQIRRVIRDISENEVVLHMHKDVTIFLMVEDLVQDNNIKKFFWSSINNQTDIFNTLTSIIPINNNTRKYRDFKDIIKLYEKNLDTIQSVKDESLDIRKILKD